MVFRRGPTILAHNQKHSITFTVDSMRFATIDPRASKTHKCLGTVRTPAQLPTAGYRPKVHLGASKATSSLITQIRTEKIGLNAFLADRHVPDKVAMNDKRRSMSFFSARSMRASATACMPAAGTKDYSKTLATPRGAKVAAHWLQCTGLLLQFNLGL
jgi:hypothetical protein